MFGALSKGLTLVLMLALIPPPLQLLSIIVQALQAHDAIVKAHPISSKDRDLRHAVGGNMQNIKLIQ